MPLLFSLCVAFAPIQDSADSSIVEHLNSLLSLEVVSAAKLNELEDRVLGSPQQVVELLPNCNEDTLYLLASACSGIDGNSSLGKAFTRESISRKSLRSSLSSLLATDSVALKYLPELSKIALDKGRDLALRSAAVARLLEHGCTSSWPIARSILLTGTKRDRVAPWANWERTGRYELAKRTLILQMESMLGDKNEKDKGLHHSCIDFEPNSSWKQQEIDCAKLEVQVGEYFNKQHGAFPFQVADELQAKELHLELAKLLKAGDEESLLQLATLMPISKPVIVSAIRNPSLKLQEAGRRCLELIPR